MERLVDYFAVVGYDFEREDKDSALRGKVLTRIPDNDIDGIPFTQGIELFCQPGGWFKVQERQPPTFFVSVLTDAEGHRSYCCVHSFSEPVRSNSLQNHQRKRTESINNPNQNDGQKSGSTSPRGEKPQSNENGVPDDYVDEAMCRVDNGEINENDESDQNKEKQLVTYTSKCLVLISRIQDFRVLKNCLGLIYTVYIEDLSQSIENVIAKLLLIRVPPHGSKMLRFSIGAADKQVLQMPSTDNLPVTRSSVTMLLRQLGILNVLNILCAALVDQKLLFYSCSYTRLTEACNALTALMYPFRYSYPYIPILPKHLLEYTSSPTPYLIGVHSSFKSGLTDLLDVVTVDLDGGVISIPECVNLPLIPEPYYTNLVETLTKVLCPDLVVADYAYPPDQVKSSEPERLDKEIRAIFLRLFCQLLMGYRSCLQVCRIHPDPIIRFKKEQYLTMRGFDLNDSATSSKFAPKLLASQAFSLFIQSMGPPYRKLHKFDEVVCEMPERLQGDIQNISLGLKHIKLIASDLYVNENPNHHPITEKIPKPSEGSHNRTQQPVFPKLCPTAAQTFMEEKKGHTEKERTPKRNLRTKKRVPEGKRPISNTQRGTVASSSRRLEVLRNLLSFIFESKTLEIKKIFQAVLRALKSRVARHALVEELVGYSNTHPQLDNQQFDYIARLINSALQDSSGQHDEYILPADILPVVTTFYRKLCPTVMQFMYTVVQEHPVWTSSLFWENAFFDDIQDAIRKLYTSEMGKDKRVKLRNQSSPTHSQSSNGRRDNQLCMEIAAIELESWEKKTPEQQKQDSEAEEGIVFSQAMHNAQRMVFMLVPLDSTRINRSKFLRINTGDESNSNSYFTSSLAGSMNGSFDEDFDESSGENGDVSAIVSKFVSKFVDRVCTEAYISPDHTKTLLNNVSALVVMQVESLRDVCMESKRLPPIKKAKLLLPTLLHGEEESFNGPIRGYLTPDGRGVATGGPLGGPVLLPAEGALFVTNYRAIFIGTPCDPLASEQVVIRSFPVSTLFKSKTFNVHDFPSISDIDSSLQHGVQLRSSTFQLLLFSFDEDVASNEQERLVEQLHALRYPNNIQGSFASVIPKSKVSMRHKTISPTVSNTSAISTSGTSSAKTLAKQVKRKVGLNKGNRISRLILPDAKSRTLYYPAGTQSVSSVSQSSGSTSTLPRLPAIDEAMAKTLSNKDTMNRLILRSSENDYKRIGLITPEHHKFRLSRCNRMFSVCRTYPTCAILPMNMTDDQIKSIAHCHHNSRFPAIVWMHPNTKTLLLRASGIRSRIASSLFKHGQKAPMLSDEGTVGSSSEEEKFLRNIAELTTHHKTSGLFRPKSSTSLNSLASESGKSKNNRGTKLTSSVRALPKSKKRGTLTRSNGKNASEQLQQINSHPVNEKPTQTSAMQNGNNTLAQFAMIRSISQQAQFYILGDKGQLKNVKHEQQGKVLFVPIELPEPKQIRTSFKTLLKSCLPADPPPVASSNQQSNQSQQLHDSSNGYLKGVEESGWLEQVSIYLQASGAIVDIMDIHGASVMLALYDGSDVVPLASSLSQLLLDPHYRTIEGFQLLIQKEWLSFGHRFAHRNRFNDAQSSGFTPVFLMFLDAVYQILNQMPMSFEFNSKLLEVIAYHSMSNRFNTFLLDSDYERLEAGILFDKQPMVKMRSQSTPATSLQRSDRDVKSLWEYIYSIHKSSTVFLNTFYSPNHLTAKILRPVSGVCRMKVWPYYLREALGEGPCYDGLLGEMTAGTNHTEQVTTEANEAWVGGTTGRRTVNACYDNVTEAQPDSIKMLLNEIGRLKSELGIKTSSWEETWMETNKINEDEEIKVPQVTVQACKEAQSIHKTLTVDLIHKNLEIYYQSQQPQLLNPQRLRSMSNVITSITNPGLRSSATTREDTISESSYMGDGNSDGFTMRPLSDLRDKVSLYDQFQTSKIEVRTYEGSLWKQGAYMRGWKLRFFVLDTTKHELRQYENKGDTTCKSIIDLKDLESVKLIDPLSNAPKGTEDKSFFEVKVAKRVYHFIATSEASAREWVDNLQVALQ